MNKERVMAAIELMKRAENLNMCDYQMPAMFESYVDSVEELHKCGNTACFAGYLAISEEFKKAGGGRSQVIASPYYEGLYGSGAVALYLGISEELAESLVFGDLQEHQSHKYAESAFYGTFWSNVKPADVIAKLEMILRGELK